VPSPAPENDATGSVTMLFRDVCAGSPEALQPLWDKYFPRLMQLARRTLGDGRQRVAGADDAVQSAFFAFWQQADAGKLDDDLRRGNLWAVLSVMTVRKARRQLRRESAQKRGGDLQQAGGDALDALAAADAFETLSPQEFDLHSEELVQRLPEPLREFALLKLMGHTNAEVSDLLGCTERTVERKLRLIRLAWEAELSS
jgi:RNA polymerase sigma factor (sigma-70 family)